MGDFGLSAAAGTAAVSCFLYARSRRVRFRPAWLLFSLSSAMAALGNLVWGWYEVVLGRPVPSPSLADLFFLCFAPPAIVGLLVLAKRPVTKAGWVCLALDAWLIGGSLLTLSWSLALAQAAKFDGPSVAHAALSLAYPLLDIALVSMVLALHFRRSAVNRTAVNTADRRARPDRDVRRPVHLAAAAQQLPLGPAARRRLVRRLAAPGVRALGGSAGAGGCGRGAHARGARAPAGQRGGARATPAPRAPAGR